MIKGFFDMSRPCMLLACLRLVINALLWLTRNKNSKGAFENKNCCLYWRSQKLLSTTSPITKTDWNGSVHSFWIITQRTPWSAEWDGTTWRSQEQFFCIIYFESFKMSCHNANDIMSFVCQHRVLLRGHFRLTRSVNHLLLHSRSIQLP